MHGKTDETFPAVADVLAIGCLLAIFAERLPKIKVFWALAMIVPVVLVPVYLGVLRFHVTAVLVCLAWPAVQLASGGLLVHRVGQPYWIFDVCAVGRAGTER